MRPPRTDGRNPATVATDKYAKAHYDTIILKVPKGTKQIIHQYAKDHGESVQGLIKRLLEEEIPSMRFYHSPKKKTVNSNS